jgi:DNA-binding response OmpR family regulator
MPDHVLIVEDDLDLAEVVQRILEQRGYETTIVGNGIEALEAVALRMPALIILDMMMPLMDGWEFAAEFHNRHGHAAPIIVVTAAESARARAAEIGADAVVTKPFDGKQLVTLVERLIGRHHEATQQQGR